MLTETEFFTKYYKALRPDFVPMKWMERLFQRLIRSASPSLVDLPTGAGKTELIVVWLVGLAWYAEHRSTASPLPRRLVWVVNRRVLVQQVYVVASRLRKCFAEPTEPAQELAQMLRSLCRESCESVFNVVQLRGQRLDDKEWSLDPTVPQLIIGTVDQIGSRLLFQGYGLGKWSRPMHAGLLGVDAWICVDEAHLVPSFAVTLRQVREMACRPLADSVPVAVARFFRNLPFWITELSATPGLPSPRHGAVFPLEVEDEKDPVIADRLLAKMTRRVLWKPQPEKKKVADDITAEALRIATNHPGSAIAVFCFSAKDAQSIGKKLQAKYTERVLLVTGRIRGYERDRLETNELFSRFRKGHPDPPTDAKPTFLVGTAAAEVGLDADASAIVCDFASLPTLVQRLGRLDRRGQLSNQADTSHTLPPTMTIIGGSNGKTTTAQLNALAEKQKTSYRANDSEYAADYFVGAAWSVVAGKDKVDSENDETKSTDSERQQEAGAKPGVDDAISSATWRVLALSSNTTATKIADEAVAMAVTQFSQDSPVEEAGDEATLLMSSLTAEPVSLAKQPAVWLSDALAGITAGPVIVPPLTDAVLQRWAATTPRLSKFLPVHPWLYGLLPDNEGTPLIGIAFRLEIDILEQCSEVDEVDVDTDRTWNKVCRCLENFPPLNSELHFVPLDTARDWLKELPAHCQTAVAHFDGDNWSNSVQFEELSPNSVLVLPTSFSPSALDEIIPQGSDKFASQRCWDVFEALAKDGAKYRRELRTSSLRLRPNPAGDNVAYRVPDRDLDEALTELANEEAIVSADENVGTLDDDLWKPARVKLTFAKDGINFELRYFKPRRSGGTDLDLLPNHLDTAADHGRQLAHALAPDNTLIEALLTRTAKDHDIGKNHQKWQQAMGNTPSWRELNGHPDSVLVAKPVIENPSQAGGYRHEWGTLWKVKDEANPILTDTDSIDVFMRGLYLHMIAAHHGYFRPSMPDRGFDAKKPTQQNQLRIESIERFGRLQKQLGYWRLAYIESLVKIADVAASRNTETQEADDES